MSDLTPVQSAILRIGFLGTTLNEHATAAHYTERHCRMSWNFQVKHILEEADKIAELAAEIRTATEAKDEAA